MSARDARGNELKVGQTVAYPVSTSMLGIDTIKSVGPKTVTLVEPNSKDYSNWGSVRRRHGDVVILEVTQ